MEPYNYQSPLLSNNDNRSWEGLEKRTARVAYPTTHLMQKQKYNEYYNKNSDSMKYPVNFQKSTDMVHGTGYWRGSKQDEEIVGEALHNNKHSPDRGQQIENLSEWRQMTHPQRMFGNRSPVVQKEMSHHSRRLMDTDNSRSSSMQGSRDDFIRNSDIEYGYTRRSPKSVPQANYRKLNHGSLEMNPKQQDDSQNYYSRRPSGNSRNLEVEINHGQESPPIYESRRAVPNSSLRESAISDYRSNFDRVFSHDRQPSDSEYFPTYIGRSNPSNTSLPNLKSNLQFSDNTSYQKRSFPDRTSRSSSQLNEFVDLTRIDSGNRVKKLPSLLDINHSVLYDDSLELIKRFSQPSAKSVSFQIQKRKPLIDDREIVSKRPRMQSPIRRTNDDNSFRQKFTNQQNKQPLRSTSMGAKKKPLTMAEQYINATSNRNTNITHVNDSFRQKSNIQNNKQPFKSTYVVEKNKPMSMAEMYVNELKNKRSSISPPPPRIAGGYVNKSKNQNALVKLPPPPRLVGNYVNKSKNQNALVTLPPPPRLVGNYVNKSNNFKASVVTPAPRGKVRASSWEVLIVPKNYPFYRYTIEELEELKTAFVELSEKRKFTVSCRKRARMLHIEGKDEKHVNWICNTYKKFSPWKGTDLKVIKINYDPPGPVAIYTNEFPNHAMTQEQIKQISDKLAEKMKMSTNEKCIEIVELIRRRGKLIVYCNNEESLKWLMATKRDLKQWEEGELFISPALKMTEYHIIKVVLPKAHQDLNKALLRLDRQNDDLNTKTWFNLNKYESDDSVILNVSVETNVLKALEHVDYKPFLDFGRIEISVEGKMKNVKEQFSVPK